MIILKQNKAEINGKKIAFVETIIKIGNYTYTAHFDEKTKKRMNTFATNQGFYVGVFDEATYNKIPEKEVSYE